MQLDKTHLIPKRPIILLDCKNPLFCHHPSFCPCLTCSSPVQSCLSPSCPPVFLVWPPVGGILAPDLLSAGQCLLRHTQHRDVPWTGRKTTKKNQKGSSNTWINVSPFYKDFMLMCMCMCVHRTSTATSLLITPLSISAPWGADLWTD